MDILKRLFGGGAAAAGSTGGRTRAGDPNGLYFYVRPDGCDEVVRVRIDRNNDLSLADDGTTFLVHKSVRGVKCFQTAELFLYFDSGRRLSNTDVEHGKLAEESDYERGQQPE